MTLTFLFDRYDLDEVMRQRPAVLAGTVVACDLGLHLHLQAQGFAHATPWDFVSPAEWPDVRRFEADVQAFWAEHGHIANGGVDLLALARFRHVACWSRVAWAAYFVERAITAVAPSTVITFEETQGHGLDQPPGPASMPLLHVLVRGIAEQRGLAVTALPRSSAVFADRAAAQARCDLPMVDVAAALAHRPFILFTGSGADLLGQAPLIEKLHARGDATVVQAYRSADADTLATLRTIGHHLWHEAQMAAAPPPSSADEASIASGEAAFRAAARTAPPALRGIFANPGMDIHFDFIFGAYARRMAEHVRRWRGFLSAHRPQLLATTYPTPALDVAVQLRIPTLLLPHGAMAQFDHRWYRCLPPCVIGATSARHARRLKMAGISEERIRVIGHPGLPGPPPAPSPAPPRLDRRRILLGTNAVASPAQICNLPETDWAGAARTFQTLGRLAARRADWEFIIKPHPRYDQVELYEAINQSLPPEFRLRLASEGTLSAHAGDADAVVFVNTRSSAIIEASRCRRPVYVLAPDMLEGCLASFGLEGWPRVADVADLEVELDTVFGNPTHYARRVAETSAAAEAFVGDDQDAAERCLAVMDQLCAAGPVIRSPRPSRVAVPS